MTEEKKKKKRKRTSETVCVQEKARVREDKITKERQDPMDGKGNLQVQSIKYCFLIPWSSFTQQTT